MFWGRAKNKIEYKVLCAFAALAKPSFAFSPGLGFALAQTTFVTLHLARYATTLTSPATHCSGRYSTLPSDRPTYLTEPDHRTCQTYPHNLTPSTACPISVLRHPVRGTSDVFQWAIDGTLWDE